jgi:hypothetical protein
MIARGASAWRVVRGPKHRLRVPKSVCGYGWTYSTRKPPIDFISTTLLIEKRYPQVLPVPAERSRATVSCDFGGRFGL